MAKQKQKQTQIVNINLGTKARKKKGKGKSKPKKSDRESKTQIIPAFNPPPIINYPPMFVAPNQPNWFRPPPVSQTNKEYAVFPEAETAGAVGLNPTVPVPLRIQRGEERVNLPLPEPNLVDLAKPIGEEEQVEAPEDDISVITEAPEFQNLPVESEGQVLDLPPAETSTLLERKESLFDPFNLPLPSRSGRSLAESIAEPPTLSSFSYPYSESGLLLPEGRFLGPLPPIKAEKSEVPFLPLPSSGLTLAPPLKVKPFLGEEPPPPVEEKKKVRQKKEKKKPPVEVQQNLLSIFPIQANVNPLGIPIQTAQKEEDIYQFSPPLSELQGQYEFIGQPKEPPKKEVGGLERRRGGGVLTGAEEALIGPTPLFLTGR